MINQTIAHYRIIGQLGSGKAAVYPILRELIWVQAEQLVPRLRKISRFASDVVC